MRISLIVAMAKNRVIGINHKMPWHLPADFAYFKKITIGHPVIMGRKTFESIGRPLPGRRNIVVSRNPFFRADGAEVAASLQQAINACDNQTEYKEIFVIGGATLYAEALARVDRIYLTEVDAAPNQRPGGRARRGWRGRFRRHADQSSRAPSGADAAGRR